jgi:hypothetical protein
MSDASSRSFGPVDMPTLIFVETAGACVTIDDPQGRPRGTRGSKLCERMTQERRSDSATPRGRDNVKRKELCHVGLGIIVSAWAEDRERTHDAMDFGDQEVRRTYTFRTEISFPSVARLSGIRPVEKCLRK